MPRKKTVELSNKRSLAAKDFYSDYFKNGTLFAAIIRSPAASGKVKKIAVPNLPEGYFLITADDIPGSKKMETNKHVSKIFGYDSVSFRGEPLGLIVGPDERIVLSLLDEVSITFDIESLEGAFKKAIKTKRPVVQLSENNENSDFSDVLMQINQMPSLDNVLDKKQIEQQEEKIVATREVKSGLYKYSEEAEADETLFTDEVIVSQNKWVLDLVPPIWKETNGAFCYMEGEKLHVYTPTRWGVHLLETISEALNIPKQNIFVHKTNTSGVFSKGLWRTTQLATQVAVAAYKLKKPIKLVITQEEQDLYMRPGVKTEIEYKIATEKSGKIKALKAYINFDVGTFNPFAQEIADRLTIAVANYYRPTNMFIKASAHTSTNPPTSISIKSVASQAFFAIENQMEELAEKTKLFPDEIRLKNLNPKNNAFPFLFDSESIVPTLNNTLKISDFNRKYASFKMDSVGTQKKDENHFFALPLRGVGLATAYNVIGYNGESLFSSSPKIEVTLFADDKVEIHAINPSSVVQEIWKKTVAEVLQVDIKNVEINSDFELEEIPNSPEDSFSTIGIMNGLVRKCCLDIQKKRFYHPLPLSSKKSLSPRAKKTWDKEAFEGEPFISNSFATMAVEVELDPYTYTEKIKGIWMTIDCGELLDKDAALKTVKLEIQQELAMLVEGKNVSCDSCTIEFISSKNKSGQIGELVHNTLPAAFSSALSLALSTQLTKLPCTEKQLYNLTQKSNEEIEVQSDEKIKDGEAE